MKLRKDKLRAQLGPESYNQLREGGYLTLHAHDSRYVLTVSPPSSWPKHARELWAKRETENA